VPTPTDQITQLEAAIAALEAQRALLGDAVVDLAVAPLRQQLDALRAAAVAPQPPPTPAMAGEFKLVTVLFADLSGFTALSERLDPEQVRGLMNACFDCLMPAIHTYDGTIDKFLGDGVIVLFGAPVTHENDAERALRACLEMQEALAQFNRERGLDLGLHFGINTGQVVAGGIGSRERQEYSVMGDPVNVAARLEELSERGEILVGGETYQLAGPLFEFEAREPVQVKGREQPVGVYRLLGLRAAPGPIRGIEGLRSPLVGRDAEVAQLQVALRTLGEGRGGILVIIGEAGQGKSRLVAEARRALPGAVTWVEGRALSYTENTSYWIVRDVLLRMMGATPETSPGDVGARVREDVARLFPGEQVEEVYPYLARLLEAPLEGEWAERVRDLTPEALQRRIVQAVSAYVRSRAQGLVLAWEDLHWADPSSLQVLEALLPITNEVPLLLLLVFRPEEGRIREFHERARDARGEKYPAITLEPLTEAASTQLLRNLLRIENLPETTLQMILGKAEGNPFFLEEVLRSLIDAGLVMLEGERAVATGEIREIDIPGTLQGVIAARIDRLEAEKKTTLQTASVIGRVFQERVLAQLTAEAMAEQALHDALGELRRREFVRLRDSTTEALDWEYIFKHVVTQEVAYGSLLGARRRELHRCVGEALEALFPERLEELSATLGYHYDRAEERERAIRYLTRAAERAQSTYANEEAIALYRGALRQAEVLAEAEEAGSWRDDAARLYESVADVLELIGRHDEARTAVKSGAAWLPPGDRVRRACLQRKAAGITNSPLLAQSDVRFNEAVKAYTRAAATLGDPPPEDGAPDREAASLAADAAWWHEWLEIRLSRLFLHYWRAQVPKMAALIEEVRPRVEAHGTPAQRSLFHHCLANMALRRDRYLVSGETLAHQRASLAAAEETGSLVHISMPLFATGFVHLFHGDLAEAEEHLEAALAMAGRTGDVTVQMLCLTYLAITHRKQGRIDTTRQVALRAREAAAAGRQNAYVAAAEGNLAWVAWREGRLAEAETQARAAQELLSQHTAMQYPFHWVFLGPLIGVAVAQGRLEEAIPSLRGLLAPTQQPLPAALASAVEAAIQTWDEGQPDATRARLEEAFPLARELGYL
jgi:class 3 adenylate cyclase/tetratricopeptide (TPR) repeat protein